MRKIVLLDRDGTIIQDPVDERVTNEEEIILFPDSLSALQKLAKAGYDVILVTNQAGIAEGRISEEDFWRINQEVVRQLESSGIKILKTYMCPHVAEDNCKCRKPKPEMVSQALTDFKIDPDNVYMVGDHRTDVLAGKAAGAKGILIKTARNHQDEAPEADFVASSLEEAVDFIIKV